MTEDLFATLHDKYKNWKPAEALLFYSGAAHGGWKALRLIVPEINREFTDNVYIGRDPLGLFYYQDENTINGAVYYHVKRVINPRNGKACASITFSNTKGGSVISEFLGYDIYENVKYAEMDGYSSPSAGQWKPNTTNSHADATIQKGAGSLTVSLDISASLGKRATISGREMTTGLKGNSLNVKGTLFYKTLASLQHAKFANYNNDRIVFYVNDITGRDFTAFFFPFVLGEDPQDLGIELGASIVLDTAWFNSG
jgi:hypothetical protein